MTRKDILAQARELVRLPYGWGGEGTRPINPEVLHIAIVVAERFRDKESLALVPGPDGSVQIEWHEDGEDVEINIDWARANDPESRARRGYCRNCGATGECECANRG